MEIRTEDRDGLKRLGALWKTTPGAEFEAMLQGMELTAWQDVIQYLRSLGMRENPQLVKLNICLSNNIRFTLEGAGVIQAYCRDNRISDKPFTAMLKESIADADPVEFRSYSAKAKLKREIPLAATDERVKDAIKQWNSLGKHFRNIQRFEFVAPGSLPLRFDVSIVRENAGRPARTFQEARVTTQPPRYEAEVELTAKRDTMDAENAYKLVTRGLSWLLQGRQRSFVLVSHQASDYVLGSLSSIFNGSGAGNRGRRPFRCPGPQPATLERSHMAPDGTGPNLLTMPGGYNVTDKADGLRCLLFVSKNGRVFLVDAGGRVYGTSKQVDPTLGGLVLDGEWIRRDKKGAVVSHYYAFDILAGPDGDTRVADLPFMVAGALLGSAAAGSTRQATMAQMVGKLGSASAPAVRGVPASQDLQIGMKTFRTAAGLGLFRDAASAVLEDAKLASYNTDGLIFTPNSEPLPIGRGTWAAQLKWKPPHENTIDFLVLVDRERDKTGAPTAADAIGSKYREDSGQTVRYKTLRLFVGSNKDAAFSDPRTTVLSGAPLPRSLEEGEWQAVEFRPLEPRDPMAAICYVAIGEGGSDPAGATAAATALDTNVDVIRATRTGDILQSDMIVEMAYHPERAPGWRWEPVRVRHDKTERWLAQQSSGGRKGGTMNAGWVANSIWASIHNPVSEEAIRTGVIVQCAAPTAILASTGGRRVAHRDLMKVQCMQNFQDAVKRQMLRSTVQSGNTLADLAMGRADDLNKWIALNVSYIFGCDVAASAVNDPDTGAYRKVLDKMIALGSRESVPPTTFVVADAARILRTGEAGLSGEDQGLLRSEFGGRAAGGFDVVSCMFALHYMFRDAPTLLGFLNNLADLVKVGGYFVGCGPDGDSIARLLSAEKTVVGRDGPSDTWSLSKNYGSVGPVVPPTELGLGLSVDLDFISAGETRTEYLVSWPYLQERLAECGLELDRTGMFGEIWASLDGAGERYAMTDSLRQLSFMNRWFVFRRTSDRRPAPPSSASIAAPVLTEQKAATVAASEAPSNSAASAAAPLEAVIEFGEVEGGEVVGEAVEAPPFYVNAASAGNDMRLGPELADWPRYLSFVTRIMPDGLSDLADPAIKYPSMEAAIASAKYQKASKRPELGAQLFRVEGVIHQKFEKDREAANGDAALIRKADDAEAANTRVSAGKAKMNSGYSAAWNPEAWEAQKVDLYKAYLAERIKVDERFRVILAAIKAQEGVISYTVDGIDVGPFMMEL